MGPSALEIRNSNVNFCVFADNTKDPFVID